MAIFLMSFVVITLAVLGMAVGVLCGRRALTGKCGGLKSVEGCDAACEGCASPCTIRHRAEISAPLRGKSQNLE
jgi:hypothetical protein